MSLLALKPPGYFGRAVDEGKLQRFLRYGLPLAPEAPGAIDWTISALSDETGGFRVTINAYGPANDAVYYGDGAGVILDTVATYAGETVSLGATEPGVFYFEYGTAGTLEVTLYALGSAGAGVATAHSVLILIDGDPGPDPEPEPSLLVWPADSTVWPSDSTIWPST